MQSPGARISQSAFCMYSWAVAIMLPQVGLVGGTPAPRKDSAASVRMEKANTNVPCTSSGESRFGSRCTTMTRRLAGAERFRGLDELQLAQHQHRAARNAGDARRIDSAERDHHVGQRRAQRRHQRDRQQDVGERHQRIGDAHQQPVELAHITGNHAQHGAADQRGDTPPGSRRSARAGRHTCSGSARRGRTRRCRTSAPPKAPRADARCPSCAANRARATARRPPPPA